MLEEVLECGASCAPSAVDVCISTLDLVGLGSTSKSLMKRVVTGYFKRG